MVKEPQLLQFLRHDKRFPVYDGAVWSGVLEPLEVLPWCGLYEVAFQTRSRLEKKKWNGRERGDDFLPT